MSALSFRNVWVEYGSQIVLEHINLEIASGSIRWLRFSWCRVLGQSQAHAP